MNEKIQNYVDELFKDVAQKKDIVRLKEELLSNTSEKYNDLINAGKSEDEAYSTVISGIGDIEGLIDDMTSAGSETIHDSVKNHKKASLMIAIAVGLYITGTAVCLLLAEAAGVRDEISAAVMICIFAVATSMVVYGGSLKKKKYSKIDNSFTEEYKEKISMNDKQSRLFSAISSSLWMFIVLVYFMASFFTGRWDVTWIIFLLGAVISQAIRSFMLGKVHLSGIIWTSAIVIYFLVSFSIDNCWHISWLVFIAAAMLQQFIRIYDIWREQ